MPQELDLRQLKERIEGGDSLPIDQVVLEKQLKIVRHKVFHLERGRV